MSVKAINSSTEVVKHNRSNNQKNQHQQSFTGSFNPVVMLMDTIEKGGFAASFIAQDGIGMVAPRIYEGLNRNRKTDENGKKTGPLNWEFARREGIREILSGPSVFLIPLGLLSIIKKVSGRANNVDVSHINALGQDFAEYAAANSGKIKDPVDLKKGYYTQVFENALKNSTDDSFRGGKLTQTAQKFADTLIEIENKRAGKDKKSAKKLLADMFEEYMDIRKAHAPASVDNSAVLFKLSGKDEKLGTSIQRLSQSLSDYTADVLPRVSKLTEQTSEKIKQFVTDFNKHRAGTRVLTNFGMWAAVVGFFTIIPKLYNLGIKHDPGLKGLDGAQDNTEADKEKSKNPSFTGNIMSNVGTTAMKKSGFSKFLQNFEFNGASMSVPATLTLLFGFCLPPRYKNAKSDKERKEILVRDISSFTAILFGAKTLSRGFSNAFAKLSGFALNIKPQDHSKSFLHKIKNYVTAGSGIEVLTSGQITAKYSNISNYKDGINGFFTFIQENGGNIKKILKMDKDVKENAEVILQTYKSKSLADATIEEIQEAFKKAKDSKELDSIYSKFSLKDNKFVTRAKFLNSCFGFASTIVLVPMFMMWLARYCEKMTKEAVEKEKAEKAKLQQETLSVQSQLIPNSKPTMAGFIK